MKKMLLSLLLIVGIASVFNAQARFGSFVGGLVGGAVGTAGAIASAPFHGGGYGYHGDNYPSYGYSSYPQYSYSSYDYPSYSHGYDYPNYYYLG